MTKRLYNGKRVPNTTDPYELAGEMMEVDCVAEGDEMLADLYFQKAERLIKDWMKL